MVFVGRFLFSGVLPKGTPIMLEARVLKGTQMRGKITQYTPLYKL